MARSVNDTHSWGEKKRRQNPDESPSQLHCAKFDCAPKSFHQLRTSMRGVWFLLNGPISSRHLLKFSLIFAWGYITEAVTKSFPEIVITSIKAFFTLITLILLSASRIFHTAYFVGGLGQNVCLPNMSPMSDVSQRQYGDQLILSRMNNGMSAFCLLCSSILRRKQSSNMWPNDVDLTCTWTSWQRPYCLSQERSSPAAALATGCTSLELRTPWKIIL